MMRHAALSLLLAVVGLVSAVTASARQLPVSIGTSLLQIMAGRTEQAVVLISEDNKNID